MNVRDIEELRKLALKKTPTSRPDDAVRFQLPVGLHAGIRAHIALTLASHDTKVVDDTFQAFLALYSHMFQFRARHKKILAHNPAEDIKMIAHNFCLDIEHYHTASCGANSMQVAIEIARACFPYAAATMIAPHITIWPTDVKTLVQHAQANPPPVQSVFTQAEIALEKVRENCLDKKGTIKSTKTASNTHSESIPHTFSHALSNHEKVQVMNFIEATTQKLTIHHGGKFPSTTFKEIIVQEIGQYLEHIRALYKDELVECAVWLPFMQRIIFCLSPRELAESIAELYWLANQPAKVLDRITEAVVPFTQAAEIVFHEDTTGKNAEPQIVAKTRSNITSQKTSAHETSASLAIQYRQNGTATALKKLVDTNRGLVREVIARYYRKFITYGLMDDMEQDGSIGLIEGAKRWDPERGYLFTTYVSYWIKASISAALLKHAEIPESARTQLARSHYLQAQAHFPDATPEQLQELTGINPTLFERVSQPKAPVVRIDAPITNDKGDEMPLTNILCDPNQISPEASAIQNSLVELLEKHPNLLDEREKIILGYTFGLWGYPILSGTQIASKIKPKQGTTMGRAGVNKIKRLALEKIRKVLAKGE